MITCTESGISLSGKVFVVCVGEDKSRSVPLSPSLIDSIPPHLKSKTKHFKRGLGVNICKARVVGEDEYVRLSFEPVTDFCFSVAENVFKRYVPKAAARFLS